jgi:hypothetical protein
MIAIGEIMQALVELDPLDGRHYPAIERAVHVLRQRGLIIEDYSVRVYLEGERIIVVFSDRTSPGTMKGSVGKPGFEVEMDFQLRITRSNFVR